MIDLENDIFTAVLTAVQASYPSADVNGEYTETPASFPCVTVVEADNRVLQYMRTLKIENYASVMYEVNIFSNLSTQKKAQAKAIANIVDSVFEAAGFTRIMQEQVPNLRDSTIYRIVCRYEAVIGAEQGGKYLVYQS